MVQARNATPGPSNTSQNALRSRNTNKRSRSDGEDDHVDKVRRRAEKRNDGEGGEKRRRRKRRRKSSVVSNALQIAQPGSLSTRSGHSTVLEQKRRSRIDGSDDEETLDSASRTSKLTSKLFVVHRMKSQSPTPEPPTDIVRQLTEQLEAQRKLVKKHEDLLTQVQQSVSCQICLDLMLKPYALAPCGHIACYGCLVKWFTTEPADGPAPPVHLRKKTCPHCRVVVRDAPVAVWNVKSIAAAITKSGILPSFNTTDTADNSEGNRTPWSHLFRPMPHNRNGVPVGGDDLGFYDVEDGGIYRCLLCMHEIWDGICSFCGHLYPGHHQVEDADDGEGAEDIFEGDWLEDILVPEHQREALERDEQEVETDEEGYESSFIDDEGDVGLPLRRLLADASNIEAASARNHPSSVDPTPTRLHSQTIQTDSDQENDVHEMLQRRITCSPSAIAPVSFGEDSDGSDGEQLVDPESDNSWLLHHSTRLRSNRNESNGADDQSEEPQTPSHEHDIEPFVSDDEKFENYDFNDNPAVSQDSENGREERPLRRSLRIRSRPKPSYAFSDNIEAYIGLPALCYYEEMVERESRYEPRYNRRNRPLRRSLRVLSRTRPSDEESDDPDPTRIRPSNEESDDSNPRISYMSPGEESSEESESPTSGYKRIARQRRKLHRTLRRHMSDDEKSEISGSDVDELATSQDSE